MGLNGQLVFKDPTHTLPAQTHPFDTPSLDHTIGPLDLAMFFFFFLSLVIYFGS